MTGSVVSILFVTLLAGAVVSHWRLSAVRHRARIDRLQVRIHVNGIRGKSSVVRLVAGVLREGGYVTVAKTTGSAARVIGTLGEESPIRRHGAATINEQVAFVQENVDAGVEALVIECMAVRPLYQAYSQDFMVRSDITVVTNVRQDHQEEMGETLEQIADSMALTMPRGGLLVTAEGQPHLRQRLARHAEDCGSTLVYADPEQVLDEDLLGFDHVEHKDNVAIGLVIARHLGIDRDVALSGMWKSVRDVGALRLRTVHIRGKEVLWVPLFAVNDPQSLLANLALVRPHFAPGATVVGILNNRIDRGRRAELFASMVPGNIARYFDHLVTFGAYEETVTHAMVAGGFPPERISNLGDAHAPGLDEILATIAALIQGDRGVLIGMVNIHTAQAELLLDHFALLLGDSDDDELRDSRDPERLPAGSQRLRRARSHHGGGSRA